MTGDEDDLYEGIPLYIWRQAAKVEQVRAMTDTDARAAWVAANPDWPDLLDAWSIVAAHVDSTTVAVDGAAA